ncbi:hypothetical protein DFJ77DRAFT_469206 [Powellomyces hirtus]|nr:hypothetical protein DFJ77DRAFT_469206 [Powellomyces hirtus]
MKSNVVLVAALAWIASCVQGEPVFSYEPTYVIGAKYQLTVDFGIADPIPSFNLTFAYGPAPTANSITGQMPPPVQSQFIKISEAVKVWNSGSATVRGANWTVGSGASPSNLQRLNDPSRRWLIAVQGGKESVNGTWQYFKFANRHSGIAATATNATSTPNITVISNPTNSTANSTVTSALPVSPFATPTAPPDLPSVETETGVPEDGSATSAGFSMEAASPLLLVTCLVAWMGAI